MPKTALIDYSGRGPGDMSLQHVKTTHHRKRSNTQRVYLGAGHAVCFVMQFITLVPLLFTLVLLTIRYYAHSLGLFT